MTHEGDEGRGGERRRRGRGGRSGAPKEKVLHTRVPAVLEEELKRLAKNLRVPVSNVVRAILEDAVDAVDTVGEVAQGELEGFVERLSRQRASLRERVRARREPPEPEEDGPEPASKEAAADEPPLRCPEDPGEVLEGVFGFQPLVLAADSECGVCGAPLPSGSEACRALFDDPGRRVLLGPRCRLMPEKE